MKLSDVYTRPFKDILEDCEISQFRVHSNEETGEVQAIELKYIPKDSSDDNNSLRPKPSQPFH